MAIERINELPVELSPVAYEVVPIDGSTTRQTTIQKLVDAGAPVASQAEAEAGVNNVKRMTALTTKQAFDSYGPLSFATAAQGALADSALQSAKLGVCFPEDFGAVGDDATNDTVAMQDAFNDGRIVMLKSGSTYQVSFLRPRDNLIVRGDGTPTIKQIASTDNNLIGPNHLGSGTLESVIFDGVIFDGFTLDGNKANQTIGSNSLQNLIRGQYTNFIFRRLHLINSVRGDVRLSNSQDGTIEYSRFIGGGKWLGGFSDGSVAQNIAIVGAATRNITIFRNYIKGIGEEVYAAFPTYTVGINSVAIIIENEAFGVNIIDNFITEAVNEAIEYVRWDVAAPNEPDLDDRPGKSIIAHNRIDGNYKGMFALTAGNNADNLVFFGNHVWRMNSHAVKIGAFMRDITISDNMIEYCDGTGVLLFTQDPLAVIESFGAVKVNDNTIQFCGGNGVAAIGTGTEKVIGLNIQNNLIRNNGQESGTYGGIRLAVSVSDAIISGNNIYDDQDLSGGSKTQDYGLLIENSSGGTAVYARNVCSNNKLLGNLTATASIVSTSRSGFAWIGNIEGVDPKLYAAKLDYNLAASGNSANSAVGSVYAGRPLTTAIVPKDDAGAAAAGAAFVSLNSDGSGNPFMQVRNLSTGAKAVGSAYVFAL